jgi:hypothetical protein
MVIKKQNCMLRFKSVEKVAKKFTLSLVPVPCKERKITMVTFVKILNNIKLCEKQERNKYIQQLGEELKRYMRELNNLKWRRENESTWARSQLREHNCPNNIIDVFFTHSLYLPKFPDCADTDLILSWPAGHLWQPRPG